MLGKIYLIVTKEAFDIVILNGRCLVVNTRLYNFPCKNHTFEPMVEQDELVEHAKPDKHVNDA